MMFGNSAVYRWTCQNRSDEEEETGIQGLAARASSIFPTEVRVPRRLHRVEEEADTGRRAIFRISPVPALP